jgi:hypothetical protein
MSNGGRAAWVWLPAMAFGACIVGFAPMAQAQVDAQEVAYCEPPAGTRLLYSNRAYEIEPKAPDAPPLYYTYKILVPPGRSQHVERLTQFLFDDGTDRWDVQKHADEILIFWPLRPGKQLALQRVDRKTGVAATVRFTVLGFDPMHMGSHVSHAWKIRRVDHFSDGSHFFQFLWYAPEFCTLSAFTDSQHRKIRLLRILKPGDRDYNRPLMAKNHQLHFADTGELVK